MLAAIVLIAAMAFDLRPASAFGNGPWCSAVVFDHSVVKSCVYRTFEECLPNVLGGNRGFCEQNPDWFGRAERPATPRHHKKRRVNRD